MPEEKKPHYRNLREAIISANLQTGSTLKNQWVYKDESDLEVFHVLEYENEDDHRRQSRTVWRVSPAEDGWRMDEPPPPWPLYRLPDIPQFQRVYICQNEADAEAACKMGLVATTSAHGCYAVDKTDWTPLAGRDVVLLPQHNQAGWVFVRKVSREMDRLLPPGEVRVVELPGLPLNGGVADFLDMQLSREPQLAGQEIDALADETPEFWTLRWSGARQGRLSAGQQRRFGGGELATAQLADVKPQEMQWLWPGRIPIGKLSLLFAGADPDPLGLDLAARVSTGLAWPDGSGAAPRGSVLLLNSHSGLADTIRPYLDRAGADLSRILALDAASLAGGGRLAAIHALDRLIERAGGRGRRGAAVRMVLIDPVSAYLSGNVCPSLLALENLAAERQVAVVMVSPLARKPSGLARLRALGGHALAASRSAWLVASDTRDAARRLLLPVKGDPGNETPGLAYRIVQDRLMWEPAPPGVRAEDLLLAGPRRKKPGPPPAKTLAAAQWLRERLATGPAYVGNRHQDDAASLLREAKDAGLSWDTLRQAFHAIGAVSERCPSTRKYRWRNAENRDGGATGGYSVRHPR